jgi:hypothetical protein
VTNTLACRDAELITSAKVLSYGPRVLRDLTYKKQLLELLTKRVVKTNSEAKPSPLAFLTTGKRFIATTKERKSDNFF